jgi:hypothetical protein
VRAGEDLAEANAGGLHHATDGLGIGHASATQVSLCGAIAVGVALFIHRCHISAGMTEDDRVAPLPKHLEERVGLEFGGIRRCDGDGERSGLQDDEHCGNLQGCATGFVMCLTRRVGAASVCDNRPAHERSGLVTNGDDWRG